MSDTSIVDLVALVGAVALVVLLQLLRAVLSLTVPVYRARRVALPAAPEPVADLLRYAHDELVELGFAGPVWYSRRAEDDHDDATRLIAAYVHAGSGDAVWLLPPAAPRSADRLVVYFTTHLADERVAVSQVGDPYFEIFATPGAPAQTVPPSTLGAAWEKHRAFVDGLGAKAHPRAASIATLDRLAADWMNTQRERLLAEGRLRLDRQGRARLRLSGALRALAMFLRAPKGAPAKSPQPAARLALLAQAFERVATRPTPRSVQILLFAVSAALFIALGGLFWSLRFAAILLAVIVLHELGHYLAMVAFGYRNVQMLALPLVGGVTLGYDANPSAARRAWMSLMGPLPGIVVGWALLYVGWAQPQLAPAWLFELALTMLAVNYLNVIPLPPLDGAHVIQAMLPRGAARLEAGFIIVACVIGGLVALQFGLTLLAVIAFLQLGLVRNRLQVAKVQRELARTPLPGENARALRLRRIFEVFDSAVGVTPQIQQRINLGLEVLRSLELKPMRWAQRGVLTAVYLLLLAGPVAAGVFYALALRAYAPDPQLAERARAWSAQLSRVRNDAFALPTADLIAKLSAAAHPPAAVPAGADDAAVEAAEARLGLALPADVLNLWRTADGVPALGLRPLAALKFARDAPEAGLDRCVAQPLPVMPFGAGDDAEADDAELAPALSVTRDALGGWLWLGGSCDDGLLTLFDPATPPTFAAGRVLQVVAGGALLHPHLRGLLSERWIEWRTAELVAQHTAETLGPARAEVAGLALPALLERVAPPRVTALFRRDSAERGPAAAQDLAAATARLGALPPELDQVLALHDGHRTLQLLPAALLQRVRDVDVAAGHPGMSSELLRANAGVRRGTHWLPTAQQLDDCVVFGGIELEGKVIAAVAVWCPAGPAGQQVVALRDGQTYATVIDYVRDRVAEHVAHDRH